MHAQRSAAWAVVVAAVLATAVMLMEAAGAQAPAAQPTAGAPAPAPGRTPWGDPDLQGAWDYATITPLERPDKWKERDTLTDAEITALNEESRADRRGATPQEDFRPYNTFWSDRGDSDGRTSLIVDPADGRLPALTPGAQPRRAPGREGTDSWEDRSLEERCVYHSKAGPPLRPGAYNNTVQLVQSPGYVALLIESIHDTRVIPLDKRPHVSGKIRLWLGDSRGWWEGDTLVVETTNFTNRTSYQGSTEHMRLLERFTRVDADTIRYQYTVTDPATWTKPWTAMFSLKRTQGLYEFACHEGNYAMTNMLSGARASEKAPGKAQAK